MTRDRIDVLKFTERIEKLEQALKIKGSQG